MDKLELTEILRKHRAWLNGEGGGSRAVLRRADLRRADLRRADLRRADLTGADLTGADLTDADLTGADLTDAVLTGAVLTGAVLTDAVLTGADLTGADLTDAVLRRADLTGADLTDAVLRRADLTGADLTDAVLTGAPIVPRLHSRILEAIQAGAHLDMGSWHTCETTHCRAGWAIVLAGEEGAKLERELGPAAAGALISVASCPALEGKVPSFYASNAEALEDITRLAALDPPADVPVAP